MFLTPATLPRLALPLMVAVAMGYTSFSSAIAGSDPYWGSKMLEISEIKFGSVAKGADTAFQVKVKNVYKEDIQITNLGTGCSCVSWDEIREGQPLPIVIPSGQQRLLTLRLDTVRYEGERKSKASISLRDPIHDASQTIDLPVNAYIRRDIVITPGAVNFGTVDQGSSAEKKVDIHYAGRSDWRLTQAKVTNPNLAVTIREVSRGEGLVNYEILFALKQQAQAGTLRDQVILMTDDQNNPQVPVLVEARIEADLIVTDLQFGVMAPGQTKQVNVVIRGKKPFKIEEIYRQTKPGSKLAEDAFKVTLSKSTATFHNLPIKFTAADPVGAFEEEFFVKIADRPQPLSFKARGRVTEQTGAAKQ